MLVRSVLFNLQAFGGFPVSLLWISGLIPLWSESRRYYFYSFRPVEVCFMTWNLICLGERRPRRMYILLSSEDVSHRCQFAPADGWPIQFTCVPTDLLPAGLSVADGRALESPVTTAGKSVPPCSSCRFNTLLSRATHIEDCYVFSGNWSFKHHVTSL